MISNISFFSTSTSPKVYGSPGNYRTAIQFGMSPGMSPFRMNQGQRPSQPNTPRGASVSRNLFGKTPPSK